MQSKEDKVSIPTDIVENLKFRILLNQNCEQSQKSLAATIKLINIDITAFFNLFLYTYDPRKKPSEIPFILWPYQIDYVKQVNESIVKGENILTEKTRDMGATWMILGVFLYRWILFKENFLIGSRKEELVDRIGDLDTLFERLRFMIRCLPRWFKDFYQINDKNQSYMKIYRQDGSSIVGESMNENFSRQGRYNAILLDEFAFVENAEMIWTACGDSAPCKVVVSTPHGNTNTFARLRKSGLIKVSTLHWKQHPFKNELWYSEQKKIRSEKDIAQELDINYSVSAGEAFYGGFLRTMHVKSLSTVVNKELILGWDYGWVHPACVISQLDAKGRWLLLDCIFGDRELIKDFGEKVKTYINKVYLGHNILSYGDPAGEQESDKSLKTSAMILAEVGFNVVSRPSNTSLTNYDARKSIIEGKLKSLIDGMPALMVNDTPLTQIIIEGFEGGYRYPDANKQGFVVDRPVKDGYFEHVFNALEYIAVNLFSAVGETKKKESSMSYRVVGDLKDIHFDSAEDDRYSSAYRQLGRR